MIAQTLRVAHRKISKEEKNLAVHALNPHNIEVERSLRVGCTVRRRHRGRRPRDLRNEYGSHPRTPGAQGLLCMLVEYARQILVT